MTAVMTKPDTSSSTACKVAARTSATVTPAPSPWDASAPRTQDRWTSLVIEHRNYLIGLANKGSISPRLRDLALRIWSKLFCSVFGGELAVPDASFGPNGELFYIWKRAEHYLSLQITENDPGEFFYLNDLTGEQREFNYDSDDHPVPADVISKLSLFMVSA